MELLIAFVSGVVVFGATVTTIAVSAIQAQQKLAKELLDHVERNRAVGDSTPAHLAEKRLDIEARALEARLAQQAEQRRRIETIEGALG